MPALKTYFNWSSGKDSASNNNVYLVAEDKMNIWAATANGLNKISKTSGAITHYLRNSNVKCVTTDAAGIVWSGNERRRRDGIYN